MNEPKPNQTAGRHASACVSHLACGKFDLPGASRLLCNNHGEWRFDELNERRAIGAGSNQEFTGNFVSVSLREPDNLSLLDIPARFSQINLRQWSWGSTTKERWQCNHQADHQAPLNNRCFREFRPAVATEERAVFVE